MIDIDDDPGLSVGGLVASLGETRGNSQPVVALLVVVIVSDRSGARREHRLAIICWT